MTRVMLQRTHQLGALLPRRVSLHTILLNRTGEGLMRAYFQAGPEEDHQGEEPVRRVQPLSASTRRAGNPAALGKRFP
jgi:hypothetical protein